MSVFAELQPHIGTAATCAALSINRSGVYRGRARWARRDVCRFPRPRRPRPPLAFSDAVLSQRLERFGLTLHPQKTRLLDSQTAAVARRRQESHDLRFPGVLLVLAQNP